MLTPWDIVLVAAMVVAAVLIGWAYRSGAKTRRNPEAARQSRSPGQAGRAMAPEPPKESEQRFRTLADSFPDGIFEADALGNGTYLNPRWEQVSGYSAAESLGNRWLKALHPDDRDRLGRSWTAAVNAGEDWVDEGRLLRPDGAVRWAGFRAAPRRNEIGTVVGFVGTIADLTERRELETRLRQSQKLEAIGQLTGGMAHDFNNILGIISGNLEILQRMVADDPRALDRIQTALKGTKRGAALTRKLLRFSRTTPRGSQILSVNAVLRGMEDLIAKSLTAEIQAETILGDPIWPVDIDPGDLEDALLNLVLNARDAMPEGGTLTIETRNRTLDETFARNNPGSAAGDHVVISVTDTGVGIPPESKPKVFDPFFSTKEKGEGTGLGLSMVFGFVKRAGGHVLLDSDIGRGTTFTLYLPRAQIAAVIEAEEASVIEDLPTGDETILVVDDEEYLIDIAVSNLQGLGYRTRTAGTAQQALEMIRNNPGIHLLFSDMVIPGGMDGYDLAHAAVDINPDLRVLLTSGYTPRHEITSDGPPQDMAPWTRNLLQKPYTIAELAKSVRRVLDDEDS